MCHPVVKIRLIHLLKEKEYVTLTLFLPILLSLFSTTHNKNVYT